MPDDSAQKLETKFEVKTTAELGARFNAVCNRRSAPVAAVLRQLIEAFCDSAGKEGLGPAAPFDIRSKQSKPK